MKNRRFIIAALLVVAATAAFVSCKKDTQNELLRIQSERPQSFNPCRITDMNAYLKDFKQQMQCSKGGETVTVEEAEWHLGSLANYDFANANVEYADIRFDTLHTNLTMTNGMIALCDLNTAYSALSSAIDNHMRDIAFENANIRYADVAISETGLVTAILTVTFNWGHTWYYQDVFDARLHCMEYFSNDSTYYANGLGKSELERILNLIESHPINSHIGSGRVYYTLSREVEYIYHENIDPYGSPSYMNSRLFASITLLNPLINENMCYYLDSYLGLGYDNKLDTEVIAEWIVEYSKGHYPSTQLWVGYHTLIVKYAIPHIVDPENPGINN